MRGVLDSSAEDYIHSSISYSLSTNQPERGVSDVAIWNGFSSIAACSGTRTTKPQRKGERSDSSPRWRENHGSRNMHVVAPNTGGQGKKTRAPYTKSVIHSLFHAKFSVNIVHCVRDLLFLRPAFFSLSAPPNMVDELP